MIGSNIRRHRKAHRLTQERLAERADLSAYFVGAVERGQAALSLRSLNQIARALRVPLRQLVEGNDDGDRKAYLEEARRRLARCSTEELRVLLDLMLLVQRDGR